MNPPETRPGQTAPQLPAEAPKAEGVPAWSNPADPQEPDTDRAGGSGNKDLADDTPKPATGGDAPSHGSR